MGCTIWAHAGTTGHGPNLSNTYVGDGIRAADQTIGGRTHFIGLRFEGPPRGWQPVAYYPFNGIPVAVNDNDTLHCLHHDHPGSLVATSDSNSVEVGWVR